MNLMDYTQEIEKYVEKTNEHYPLELLCKNTVIPSCVNAVSATAELNERGYNK